MGILASLNQIKGDCSHYAKIFDAPNVFAVSFGTGSL